MTALLVIHMMTYERRSHNIEDVDQHLESDDGITSSLMSPSGAQLLAGGPSGLLTSSYAPLWALRPVRQASLT